MKYTLNQLIKQFEYFASAHSMIHSFSYGELSTLSNEEQSEVIYPLMHVNIQDGSIDDQYVYLNFNILLMDLVQKDNSNIEDVQSDTLLILNDFRTWLNRTKQFTEYGVFVDRAQLTPFVDRFTDEVTGHRLLLYLKIRNLGNLCNIPFYVVTEPVPFNCAGHEPIIEFGGSFQTCENSFINITADNVAAGQTTSATTFVWSYAGTEFYTGSTYFNAVTPAESAGRYTVTATNNSGCTASSFIDVVIFEKPVLQITNLVNESAPGAFDGSYTVEVTNSQGGFYLFTDGFNTNFDGIFTGIGAGEYVIEVTDQNSCTSTIPVTIA